MIVIDTSVFVDSLFEKDNVRYSKSNKFLYEIKGCTVFVPRIFIVEFLAVASRLGLNIGKEEVMDITSELEIIPEEAIFELVVTIAEKVHPRAVDAYFIATAKLTNSILVSNDKKMVKNAKSAGIESYYLIEEFDKCLNTLKNIKKF